MASGLKQPDLDKVLQEFVVFQQYISDGHNKTELLEEQLQTARKFAATVKEREKGLQQELETQQGLMTQLHEILGKRCDLEEKYQALQKELEEMMLTQRSKEEAQKERIVELETAMEDQQTAHQVELVELQETLKQQALEEQAKFEQALQTAEQLNEQLQQQLSEQEEHHQVELDRSRQEYENKLLKLQKQTSKQHALQRSAANQDIFRQKLHHLKVQSQQEISSLKKAIEQLQQQLAVANQHQKPTFSKRRRQ